MPALIAAAAWLKLVGAAQSAAVEAGQELCCAVAVEVRWPKSVACHVPARSEPEVVSERDMRINRLGREHRVDARVGVIDCRRVLRHKLGQVVLQKDN